MSQGRGASESLPACGARPVMETGRKDGWLPPLDSLPWPPQAVNPTPGLRAPPRPEPLLPLPGPTPQGRAGFPPPSIPTARGIAAACLHPGPCRPSRAFPPPNGCSSPSQASPGLPAAPSPASPSTLPPSGSLAGPALPDNTCQAQRCHPPAAGDAGRWQGLLGPGMTSTQRPASDQRSRLLCAVPGPALGPVGLLQTPPRSQRSWAPCPGSTLPLEPPQRRP